MIIRSSLAFAIAALALTFAAAPYGFSQSGLGAATAVAREAESGGNHRQAGDDRGGQRNKAVDDNPGASTRKGKNK